MRWFAASVVLCVWTLGAHAQTADDRLYLPLASALTKLAAAVDAYVADSPVAGPHSTEEVLKAATAHDPSLLSPFRSYLIRIGIVGRDSSVLLCTTDRMRALIEDAGCTARSDSQRWRLSTPAGCIFSLDLLKLCHQPPSQSK
jgi:hypothetical protein